MIYPSVQIKSVEGYPLFSDRDFGQKGTHFRIEPVSVHAEITGDIPKPDQPRDEMGGFVFRAIHLNQLSAAMVAALAPDTSGL